jgi:hypothetical protein
MDGKKLKFEFNWCDYKTPCPYKNDIFIGDYDCYTCEHNKEYTILDGITLDDKMSYLKIGNGIVICNYACKGN